MARFGVVVSLAVLLLFSAARGQVGGSDPQALNFAAASVLALTGGAPLSDVILRGNVISLAGSDYLTGEALLQAKGLSQSRVELAFAESKRTEVRTMSAGFPSGGWTISKSNIDSPKARVYAFHNCWTDAAWFFPALSSLTQTSDPHYVFSYVGKESRRGITTQHVRVAYTAQDKDTIGLNIAQLSTTDYYLDAGTLLPLVIAFNIHPDNDMGTDIPSEIRFAKYQVVNGAQIPFHIQRLVNGGVVLDLTVAEIRLNSNLPDNTFRIQ